MAKTFMGVRLRSLRAERGMTQLALAHALGLSPSYVNQLEQAWDIVEASEHANLGLVIDAFHLLARATDSPA